MKSPICTILLSKLEFSFALLLVTFEPFDLEQSYIPHLKALMCGINAAEAQRCDCMFTFCYAYPKLGVLLHKMANASHSSSGTVGSKTSNGLGQVKKCIKFFNFQFSVILFIKIMGWSCFSLEKNCLGGQYYALFIWTEKICQLNAPGTLNRF